MLNLNDFKWKNKNTSLTTKEKMKLSKTIEFAIYDACDTNTRHEFLVSINLFEDDLSPSEVKHMLSIIGKDLDKILLKYLGDTVVYTK